MKTGQKVAVCHDGKYSRRILGEIVKTRNGHHIKVRFPNPETGFPVEFWARKIPAVRYKKTQERKYVTMIYSKKYAYFAGWANIDWFSPWYSIEKWEEQS